MLPPSIHPDTDKRYEWLHDGAMTELPRWLLTLAVENHSKTLRKVSPEPTRGQIYEGEGRNQALTREAGWLLNIYKSPDIVRPMVWAYNNAVCVPPLTEEENSKTWQKSLEKWAAKANVQETQDKPQEEIQPYDREQYLKVLSQWLYLEDQQAIDIIMATAICICLPGDPIWMLVITASGGMKTELLRTFSNKRTYSISTLTPQTLISGLKGGKDIDLMPKLDGKLLIIKDFTSILSKKAEDQAGIFADLREAYDGYLEKSFGSGAGTKRYKSSFGVLAGVTDAIDMYRVVHALLGERFLKCRLHTNPKEAIERASSLAGKEVEMRVALTEATNSCMAYYAQKASQCEDVIIEKDTHQKIKALADLTAKLRSEVARDRFHKVLYQPQPEVGTRLAKQFRKLAQGLSVFYEDECIGEAEYNVLLRIAQDTVPKQRMKLVLGMMDAEPLTTKAAGDRAEIPTETAKEILEDLWMLKLIARTGDSTFFWQLTDSMHHLLLDSGLGTQNTLRTHKNNNNRLG